MSRQIQVIEFIFIQREFEIKLTVQTASLSSHLNNQPIISIDTNIQLIIYGLSTDISLLSLVKPGMRSDIKRMWCGLRSGSFS